MIKILEAIKCKAHCWVINILSVLKYQIELKRCVNLMISFEWNLNDIKTFCDIFRLWWSNYWTKGLSVLYTKTYDDGMFFWAWNEMLMKAEVVLILHECKFHNDKQSKRDTTQSIQLSIQFSLTFINVGGFSSVFVIKFIEVLIHFSTRTRSIFQFISISNVYIKVYHKSG